MTGAICFERLSQTLTGSFSTYSCSLDGPPWIGLVSRAGALLVLSGQVKKNISAEFPGA